MALTQTLKLKVQGTDIAGNSRYTDERADTIDVLEFKWTVAVRTEGETQRAVGKPKVGVLKFKKEIDKASPAILDALVRSKAVEFVFEMRVNDPAGGGSDIVRTTITGTDGTIVHQDMCSPDSTDPENADCYQYEEVHIAVGQFKVDDVIDSQSIDYDTRSGAA